MRIERIAVLWSVALVMGLRPATALDPHTRITQDFHTAWRVQDGTFGAAPGAVTQTADGYIWIGTGSGLVRYDGVRFEPWAPPPGKSMPDPNVISLRGSSDGTLWIGTARGLVSWKNNSLREHLQYRINAIVEDHKGRIWVARGRVSAGGLCQVTGEHPGCFGGDDRMKFPSAGTLAEDVHGNLWVGGGTQLLRWRDGSFDPYFREQLASRSRPIGVESVAAAPDGSVWVSVPSEKGLGLLHIVDGLAERVELEGVKKQEFTTVFVDRVGALWLATVNDGLYRFYNGQVDHFGSRDGLSSDTVGSFFEDREGNLWVTTSKGLDFFRDSRVVTFSTSEGLSSDYAASVLAADDGTVWVGNRGNLDAIHEGKVTSIPIPGYRVTALWEDHDRRLWVGIDNLLTVYERGQFRKVNRPDGSPLGTTTAIGEDREQNIWAIANPERKLFRIRDMRVEEEFSPPKIPAIPRLVTADPSGGVWLGFTDKFLGHYRSGKLDVIGQISATDLIAEADGSIWALTRSGLVRWKDGRTQTLTSKNGLKCDTIYSGIRDNQRTLWLYTACGLIGIADSELDRWLRDPASLIQSRVLDALDGARPSSSTFQPAASKSPDGRLWFANDGSVQMFDPNRSTQNRPPPPVYVERIQADRKEYTIEAASLPPNPRDIEIKYTALSYSIPQRVRFRYKLEPRDQDWQDAGTRRQAFYSDLRPGEYRFHVTASNGDGVWNDREARLEFSIAPAYYQTNWFRASVVAAFFIGCWGMYRMRVHQLAREFAAQTEERTRIARELHDTLLQSFQASLIQMQVARNTLDQRPENAVQNLDRAITTAAGAVAEGRSAIQDLRAQAAGDLAQLLTAAAQELSRSGETPFDPPAFRVTVEGERRDLRPLLHDEVYCIARELLRNAFRHAHAGRIEAEIRYESRQLRVHVRDDGKGIDPEILKAGGRAGHFGVSGMRERVDRFGGTLEFWSEAGAGTEALLTVPAVVAYGSSDRSRFSLLRRKKASA